MPDLGIRLQRVYEPPAGAGRRVLVDRVWPRGVKREAATVDLWARDVAPSNELRKWFGHRPERWDEFQRRYREELETGRARQALDELEAIARREPLTLLFGAADRERNQAVVLRDVLSERLGR